MRRMMLRGWAVVSAALLGIGVAYGAPLSPSEREQGRQYLWRVYAVEQDRAGLDAVRLSPMSDAALDREMRIATLRARDLLARHRTLRPPAHARAFHVSYDAALSAFVAGLEEVHAAFLARDLARLVALRKQSPAPAFAAADRDLGVFFCLQGVGRSFAIGRRTAP